MWLASRVVGIGLALAGLGFVPDAIAVFAPPAAAELMSA